MIKKIKGFGNYTISNKGVVVDVRKNRILTQYKDRHGTLRVSLTKDKKHYTRSVKRLVATAFLTKKPNKTHIIHKNGNKEDNRALNLKYISEKDHVLDMYKKGIRNSEHLRKLDKKTVKKIYKQRNILSIRALATKYNSNYSSIYLICKGVTYKNYTQAILS